MQEIVKELLFEKNLLNLKQEHINQGDPNSLNILIQKGVERQRKAHARLIQDPALSDLIKISTQISLAIGSMNVPQEMKYNGFLQILVETIEVWEEANNRFNEQLKSKI